MNSPVVRYTLTNVGCPLAFATTVRTFGLTFVMYNGTRYCPRTQPAFTKLLLALLALYPYRRNKGPVRFRLLHQRCCLHYRGMNPAPYKFVL